jgi:elongation factor Tu
MAVADIFGIVGRGTVVTGHIESGTLKVGDEVLVNRLTHGGGSTKAHVIGLQAGPKTIREAKSGELVGVLLRGISRDAVSVGDTLSAAWPEV